MTFRKRIYHADVPQGQVFEDPEEVLRALKEGWVEAPWLIHESADSPDEEKQPVKRSPGRPPAKKE